MNTYSNNQSIPLTTTNNTKQSDTILSLKSRNITSETNSLLKNGEKAEKAKNLINSIKNSEILEKKKIGKMTAFWFRNGEPVIAIGPNWRFFTIAMSMILLICLLYFFYLWKFLNFYIKFGFLLSFLTQTISYSYTALINPGIRNNSIKSKLITNFDENEVHKYQICNYCNLVTYEEEKVEHCYECEVCVEERDHHCPWTTKCVGKHNLISFYIFIASTVILFGFCYIGLFFSIIT